MEAAATAVAVMEAVATTPVVDTTAADIIMATITTVIGTGWRLVQAATTAMVRVMPTVRTPIGNGERRAAPIGARGTTPAEVTRPVPARHGKEGEASMRKIVVGLLSAALLVAFTDIGSAEKRRRHKSSYYGYSSGVTERQLRNLRAYERGQYYERDSNALPVGSRPWWEQKEREGGGMFRP
jgi:hypothetical protein